jgi:hypothetical protein
MAVNDILLVGSPTFGPSGAVKYNVGLGATAIYCGDPVIKTLGGTNVTVMTDDMPNVGTDYVVGIATSKSTQTASADGYVYVERLVPGQIWSIAPKVAATWDTQAEYDALVGKRVLIDLTSGVYTLLAADNSAYGCIVMAKDVNIDKNKIYFCFRNACSNLA